MNSELLALLDYLERDRGLDREVLARMIEESVVSAVERKSLGRITGLRVHVDPKTGDLQAVAKVKVVERVQHRDCEVDLATARRRLPEVKEGDEIEWEVPPEAYGRIVAQTAKQGIMQRMRQAEKELVCDEFRERIGEILYGTVSRFDRNDVIISLDRAEGVLRQMDRVPSEEYQLGDHLCCVLTELNMDRPGPILVLSRASPLLVQRLFEREVTEIAEHLVEIKGVAREPGFRSKIAVFSKDPKVDPVGACVGIRGNRVKSVVRELNGEKVDIIRWAAELPAYVTQALQPAEIRAIRVDDEHHAVEITVAPDQLSLAIGRRGQNARLTARLTGWRIDIKKIEEQVEASMETKIQQAVEALLAALPGVAPEIAARLVQNGYSTVEGLKEAELADLEAIEGIDHDLAVRIKQAAGS